MLQIHDVIKKSLFMSQYANLYNAIDRNGFT